MKGGNMADFFEQQADWLKTWQESQETLMKQYTGLGEEWMAKMLGTSKKDPDSSKDRVHSQAVLEEQFREFSQRMNEMAVNAWGGKIPAEMSKFMDISFFGEFYKNWLSSLQLPEGMKTLPGMDSGWQQATDFLHSFLEKNNPFFSSFSNPNIAGQMSRFLGMMLGTLGQEEGAISNILTGYQDLFSKMFESTTAESIEKLAEAFDSWAQEMEKRLSAPKMGINRELAHDMSQLLVLSQDYVRAYSKIARLVEATGRKAGLRFQAKLSESALKNKPVDKFVDLCALWSVENEAIFSEVMASEEFAKMQGDFLDAGHRLKIHLNMLAERALEPTPIALKRDLDLAIEEITQLKRDMRILQRELQENGQETRMARAAQAAAEEELKKTRIALNAAEAAALVKPEKATAAAGAPVAEPAKKVRTDKKTVKAATKASAKTKSVNAQ
jgi:poly(hydroxyalkanoate) synthase III subunit E